MRELNVYNNGKLALMHLPACALRRTGGVMGGFFITSERNRWQITIKLMLMQANLSANVRGVVSAPGAEY